MNGHLTGRKEGSPITDLALSMLANIEKSPDKKFISYFNNARKDRPLKSSTIAIYGENQRVIGLLCINLYLNMPFSTIIESFVQNQHNSTTEQVNEAFLDNTDDLMVHTFLEAKNHVIDNPAILAANKNKEIIFILYSKGVFNLKDAIIKVAELLNISKNTVYMHIRNIKQTDQT